MAFIQFKFDQVTRQTRDIFNTYIYETDDTIAEVLVTGYFDACRFANSPDWVGSIIQCKCSDTYAELYALAGGATELVMPAAAVVAANVQTLADAVAYAESGLQVNGIVTTVEYNADTGIGGNTYQKLDAGSSGARPAEDGGSVIYVGDDGLYLKSKSFDSTLDITKFGAVSGQDCTTAIDNVFAFCEANLHGDAVVVHGERPIWRVFNGWEIAVPRGSFTYNGTGHVIDKQKSWKFKGIDASASHIKITSDCHLLLNSDSSTDIVGYVEFSDLKITGGRGAYFSTKLNLASVQHGRRAYNCIFAGYTSVAFGSIAQQDARWVVKDCIFEGGDTGTPVGLCLPDEVAETDITGNTFAGNTYQIIILPEASRYNIGPNNSFFKGRAGMTRNADILIVPTNTYRNGEGLSVVNNRFSNENAENDKTVLIAELDSAQDDHVFVHLTTKSNGWAQSISFTDNKFSRAGDSSAYTNPGVVYTYAYKIGGLVAKDNLINSHSYFLEFDGLITDADIDAGQNLLNRFYPRTSGDMANLESLIDFSNRDGAGLVYRGAGSNGMTGEVSQGSAIDAAYFVQLLTTNSARSLGKGTGVTGSNVIDADGGTTGSEVTFTTSGPLVVSGSVIKANLVAGDVAWIEFDIKQGDTDPLTGVKIEVGIGNNNAGYTIPVSPKWRRVSIPFVWADDYTSTGTWQVYMRAAGFLNVGVAEKIQIGRVSLYHSPSQLAYTDTEI